MTVSADRARRVLDAAHGKRIAVVGDFMLDRHLTGTVRRISPEAPVPVVEVESERAALGGAGNVVQNISALGATPVAFGVIGDDQAGLDLLRHLDLAGCGALGMIKCPSRRTTEKTRIIAHDQHVVRADRETIRPLERSDEDRLIEALRTVINSLDALICQDYNKGVLSTRVIEALLSICRTHEVRVAVDPKFDHFFEYAGCGLFKPNVRELESALGKRIGSDDELFGAAAEVFKRVKPSRLLVTRGERGMELFTSAAESAHIPTRAKKVHDVSGAGDTVISTYVVAECGGATPLESAVLANQAAGIVCGEVGVVPIHRDQLLADVF
ncbi:D-glycero-beta-D-manno-heptose-7-phosphate kinase [candidate division KSB1 bacterium]|nr:D-glycero-beta-D-manno-heptose-7-phosphate kinase [candidate division KSB1 bacterium]